MLTGDWIIPMGPDEKHKATTRGTHPETDKPAPKSGANYQVPPKPHLEII